MKLSIKNTELKKVWEFDIHRFDGGVRLSYTGETPFTADGQTLQDAIQRVREQVLIMGLPELDGLAETIKTTSTAGLPEFRDGKPIMARVSQNGQADGVVE